MPKASVLASLLAASLFSVPAVAAPLCKGGNFNDRLICLSTKFEEFERNKSDFVTQRNLNDKLQDYATKEYTKQFATSVNLADAFTGVFQFENVDLKTCIGTLGAPDLAPNGWWRVQLEPCAPTDMRQFFRLVRK
jgi:hypothetical protein